MFRSPAFSGIVTENLILYLDPGNPLSYPGSGTTWTNLVTTNPINYNISTTSLPAFRTNSFSYNGTANNWTVNRPVQDDFSLGMWFKTTSTSGTRGGHFYQTPALFGADKVGLANDFGLSIANGQLQWGGVSGDIATTAYSSNFYNDGAWHYVIATRTKSTGGMAIYVDGIADGSSIESAGLSLNSSATMGIGWNASDAPGQYYTGFIGAVHIYDRVLTPDEIVQNYTRSPRAFAPIDISSLNLWLDAADVTGTGSNPADGTLATWVDKSGVGGTATAFGSPTLSSTAVNGKPGVSLNGTSMGYRGAVTNSGTVVTAFVVATLDSGAKRYGRLVSLTGDTTSDVTNPQCVIPFYRDPDTAQNIAGYRTAKKSTRPTPGYATPFYAASIFDNTNNTVYVNGTAGTPVGSTGSFLITKYGLGIPGNGSPATDDYWKGYVSEVLVYNSALSTTNRQAVEAYLATKWGI